MVRFGVRRFFQVLRIWKSYSFQARLKSLHSLQNSHSMADPSLKLILLNTHSMEMGGSVWDVLGCGDFACFASKVKKPNMNTSATWTGIAAPYFLLIY
jgi:hypothetical protein